LQSINRDLSSINFVAANTVLRMRHEAETIEEFSKKYFLVGGSIYEETLEDVRQDFAANLLSLEKTARSDKERGELEKLSAVWADYWKEFEDQKARGSSGDLDELPIKLAGILNRLKAQTETLSEVIQLSIRDEVRRASQVGQAAERFSWLTGAVALILSIGVALVIVSAINTPLRQLTRSTHLIAKGQFWHRLPADGSDEFGELARDFNAMTQRLGELDQMKKDFVSHVSHELKAPLAAIRQMVHLLIQEIPGSLNEQQKRLLRLSYASAERLSAMVANLLDVSRMEAGTMEYEMSPHDLAGIVQSVAHEFELQAQEKKVRLRLQFDDSGVKVQCDRDRIAQVVGNLLENALKFSPENSEIVVRIERAVSADGLAKVSVIDSGPGVPDAHKHKVFLKFHQVKQGKKIAGQGVGLGLAISKTIVEAHHGSIWVEDNPAGGSIFCFALQAVAQAEAVKCG
jgi:two-component system sensor histidine kinase GlrK